MTLLKNIKNRIFSGQIPYYFMVLCLWLLSVEEPAAKYGLKSVTIFRNLLPVLAAVMFVVRSVHAHKPIKALFSPECICGIVFALSGMIGWAANRYQRFDITAFSLFEHLRFWICIWLFRESFKVIDLHKYALKLFVHTAIIGGATVLCGIADMIFFIWPRQMFRYGTSSLQLFYGHPSNLGAHCVFLLGMLCILYPHIIESTARHTEGTANVLRLQKSNVASTSAPKRNIYLPQILCILLILLLLGEIAMTLRVRLFGFVVFFILLFIWMILLRKKISFPAVFAGTAAALAIGWKRLYNFYFSPFAYTMARGQFASNSLDLARENLPFGSGFGTFGSRMAQFNYSPLYYRFNMMITPGMNPAHPSYACDTFFPVIIAESGWLGTAAYAGLIILLLVLILRIQKTDSAANRHAALAALSMLAFEILDAFGALSFSETYSIMISMVIGSALAIGTKANTAAYGSEHVLKG